MAPALSSRIFCDCLQSNFTVGAPSGSVPIVLVEVNEGVNTDRVESFSLLFRGPISPFFPQAIYRLHHEKLGTMDLFLVPMGPDRDGMRYEAVFNRLRTAK